MASQSQGDFAAVQTKEERDRAHFLLAVTSLLEEEKGRGLAPASGKLVRCLAEVGYKWTTTSLKEDLEAFRRHAKRATVAPEDVILAARKNRVTQSLLEQEHQRLSGKRKRS